MRRYVFTGLGVLAGFLVGALIVGALVSGASIISNDAILISELLLGTIGAVAGGTLGWYGPQPDTSKTNHKKR